MTVRIPNIPKNVQDGISAVNTPAAAGRQIMFRTCHGVESSKKIAIAIPVPLPARRLRGRLSVADHMRTATAIAAAWHTDVNAKKVRGAAALLIVPVMLWAFPP